MQIWQIFIILRQNWHNHTILSRPGKYNTVNRIDWQALTFEVPTVTRLVQDPLTVLSLDNRLLISINFVFFRAALNGRVRFEVLSLSFLSWPSPTILNLTCSQSDFCSFFSRTTFWWEHQILNKFNLSCFLWFDLFIWSHQYHKCNY